MAKIILGARPKTFKRIVTVDLPEGGKGSVEVEYRYRTRTDFGAFVDDLLNATGVTSAGHTDEEVKFSLANALQKNTETNAEYILKIVDGWNLDQDFSLASVKQLCNELPGAAQAIMETYRQAIAEGRLGN